MLFIKRTLVTAIRHCSFRSNMCRHTHAASATTLTAGKEVLPTNVKPLHYKLRFEPIFSDFTFKGEETIDFDVKEDTDYITLNSLEIKIDEAKINGSPVKLVDFDEDKQRVTFKLPESLKEGLKAQLDLKFIGELNDKMAGFYRSLYVEDGETKYLATTQMEPTDCRRAFPCYDEPAAKAKFSISLVADEKLVCLSNMDEKSTTKAEGGKKVVEFNTTPLMLTYLVAFIVGDLKYVENNDYRVPIKVWATPGSEQLGQYSADIAAKTLKFYDAKFEIDYPLPKLDMVAIHDFSAGAMENYGLITYRTVDLLLDPENTNINTKQRVTEVVMHELAHQWFGNLVTMTFWDYLYLNEGFATYMLWYACNELFPDWKVWELYVLDSLQHALALDALRSSHPIEVPVKRADEINQIFDAISYSKGSLVLKMLAKWLGEDVFVKGVLNYLKAHKWGNATSDDLWKALADALGKDVLAVMNVWTKKVGFPVVHVEEDGTGKVTVTQNRFLATGDVKPEEDQTLYPVFLGLKTLKGVDESLVLNDRQKTIEVNDDFFKLNADQSGVYRTAYSTSRWTKLGEAGNAGKLTVEDRVGLVADAGSLALSGVIDTTALLELVQLWDKESNYVVWEEILTRIGTIKAAFIFEDKEVKDNLKKFTVQLVKDKLNEVGWNFSNLDSFAEQQLKLLLFGLAVGLDYQPAVDHAHEIFKKFINGDAKAIHPNLKGSVFQTVAKTGGKQEFDQLFKIYTNPSSSEEKIAALRAFGRFEDDEVLAKVCSLLLDTEVIKAQDIYIPMQGMRAHSKGIETLWQWITSNWDKVYKLLPPGLSMLGSVVTLSTLGFTNNSQKKEVEEFFAKKDTKGYDQGLAQSLDMITAKASWVSRDLDLVSEWLKENVN